MKINKWWYGIMAASCRSNIISCKNTLNQVCRFINKIVSSLKIKLESTNQFCELELLVKMNPSSSSIFPIIFYPEFIYFYQMKSSINLSRAYDVGCCESGLWHHPATSWSIWLFCSSIFPFKLYLYTNFVVCHVYYTFPIFSSAYPLCNSLIINHLKITKMLNTSFNSSYITEILCLSTKSCTWLGIFPIPGASLGFEWLVEFWNCLRF